MSISRISLAVALALSATVACAQGATPSIEERLQQLEAEQAAMRQQLAERDRMIEELRREMQAQQGQAAAPGTGAAPTTAAAPKAPEQPATTGEGPERPPLEHLGEAPDKDAFTPEYETWGVYDPGTGFRLARTDFGDSSEYILGMNWYPWPTRNHRLNLQLLDVNKSPVSSTFGYYTGGQDGWTVASSFNVFF